MKPAYNGIPINPNTNPFQTSVRLIQVIFDIKIFTIFTSCTDYSNHKSEIRATCVH